MDYTRIPILTSSGADLKVPVCLSIGNIDFKTYLQYGKTLSPEEQDAIIRGCMMECELTSDEIAKGMNTIREAKKNKGFAPQIIWKLVMNAVSAPLPSAAGNVYSFGMGRIDVAQGNATEAEMREDFIVGTIVGTLIGMGFQGIPGLAISVLAASGKDIAKEVIRLLKENETAQRALEYEVLFQQFYSLCNERLTNAMKDETGWHITGKNMQKRNITAFSSATPQYWSLDFDLVKVSGSDAPLNWNGTYEGYVHLKIDHNTVNMDKEFLPKVFMKWPMAESAAKVMSFYDKTDMTSVMWKQLRNNAVRLEINLPTDQDGRPQMKYTGATITEVPLSTFEEQSRFLVLRKVRGNPKIFEQVFGENSDGAWDAGAIDGSQSEMLYIAGDMSDNYKYPLYMYLKADISNRADSHVPFGGHVNMGWQDISFGTVIAKDTQVYKELNDGYLRLTYGWGGWN